MCIHFIIIQDKGSKHRDPANGTDVERRNWDGVGERLSKMLRREKVWLERLEGLFCNRSTLDLHIYFKRFSPQTVI